ncbi:MAG: hypothetical protein HY985_03545 [Magnetospirillum sp.]|nr:hypothetical protein [Magnetospirillum sp.]
MMHGMLPHPDPIQAAKLLAPQLHPITRRDLALALFQVGGLPAHPDIKAFAEALAKTSHPAQARATFDHSLVYLALGAIAGRDYPKEGRHLLGKVVLPYRRLVAFCRRHDLIEPEVLRRRLAGLPIPDSQITVPPTQERGRPHKHLDRYMAKFEERIDRGAVLGNPMDEARFLRTWLKECLASEGMPAADNDLPREETIRNKIIAIYDFRRRHRKSVN